MSGGKLGIGVVGAGLVSHAYLGSILRSERLELRGIASRSMGTANSKAALYKTAAVPFDRMLQDPGVAIIVNLTPPDEHHALNAAALKAGKHVYSEKPLTTTLTDAAELLALAKDRDLRIGCAPDTFLGIGQRTARSILDSGVIGKVTGGSIAMGSRGMEAWHPNPDFFFARGGGPLLDIGPYYLTALVNLLGPVVEVTAIGTKTTPRHAVRADGERREILVTVPTTVTGSVLFASGANVSLSLSWDVGPDPREAMVLFGDQGTLIAPDPNFFDGEVRICRNEGEWETKGEAVVRRQIPPALLAKGIAALEAGIDPLTGGQVDSDTMLRLGDLRGLGLEEFAEALDAGRAPAASGELALHILEILLALEHAAEGNGRIRIATSVDRPPFAA